MRTPIAFIFGALAATLVAAAAFRGAGQPLDSTFTYQGQLRNAGQLVSGNVDVRFTLWDSDVGGTQIGNANSFTNYPLTDGRFALGLNFGTGAFNGDQRWVQVEFRNPAGAGQYLTLAPRDKILAAPYALYALNSTASQWDYNPKTQALTSAQNVAKVGIGTNAPTAALEVVAAGGDDAVKLPAGSIGAGEMTGGIAMLGLLQGNIPDATRTQPAVLVYTVQTPNDGFLLCEGLFEHSGAGGSSLSIDAVGLLGGPSPSGNMDQRVLIPLSAGTHVITITTTAAGSFPNGCRFDLALHFAMSRLTLNPQ
jgi:hypothetical protein